MNPRAPSDPPPVAIRRLTRRLPPDSRPLDWLRGHQSATPRLYWRPADGGVELAGWGAHHRVQAAPDGLRPALDALQALLRRSDPGVEAVGGLRFDPLRPPGPEWRGFETLGFVVPRFVVTWDSERNALELHAQVGADEDMAAARGALDAMAASPPTAMEMTGLEPMGRRRDVPERAAWDARIDQALAAISDGTLVKVVLARRSDFTFGREVDALELVRRLGATTSGCTVFCLEPQVGAAFLGATPECLFERTADRCRTEALAGTRPRGCDAVEDRRLGDAMLTSDKDRREHFAVRASIRDVLAPLCQSVTIAPEPELRRLARSQHLCSRIEARVRPGVSDAALLEALHPTPAVGGTPTAAALAWLRDAEPFDRGGYAAPVGRITADGAQFVVAIRSALCRAREVSVFAGAGVVAGSTAAGEWDEIEHKMRDFAAVWREAEA